MHQIKSNFDNMLWHYLLFRFNPDYAIEIDKTQKAS